MRSGRPALLAGGGMTLDCSDVRLLSKDPLPQKGPDSLVVWLTYDKRKYAFKNGLAPKGCPLTNAWIECVRDAKLPIPGERVTFRIHGLQDDGKFSAKGTDVAREHPGELPTEVRKIGCWVRDANGGIPVEEYAGKVFVVNNQRISVTQRQSVLDALAMAAAGADGRVGKRLCRCA